MKYVCIIQSHSQSISSTEVCVHYTIIIDSHSIQDHPEDLENLAEAGVTRRVAEERGEGERGRGVEGVGVKLRRYNMYQVNSVI